jgi:tripartite-type tricarboxylate transporter receptor subunit TctC
MHRLIATAVCSLLGFAGIASAQTDPIVILTTYPATGSSSRATTILAPRLEEFLGRDTQMDYGVGVQAGVAAPADERTIFVSTIGNMALLPAISESFGIDPLSDLRPVTRLTAVPDVLIVRSGLGINTLEELLNYTRRHPGALSYSYISPRSIHRLEFSALLNELGIDVTLDESVRSSAPAMEAITNGTVDLVITTSPYVSPLIESGAAVPLVIVHPTRIPLLPGVPTMLERGVMDMPSGSWGGLFAPAGSSDEFVAQIFEAVLQAMKDPGVTQEINELGMEIWPSESPKEFSEFIEAEMTRLRHAAEKYGMRVD